MAPGTGRSMRRRVFRLPRRSADIDRDDELGKLRQQMEQIVSQRDVRFQDRCLALIPLLRPHLPGGGKLQ